MYIYGARTLHCAEAELPALVSIMKGSHLC